MASLRMLRRANLFSRRRCCLSQLPATQLPCSFYVMVMRWSCNGFYDDPSPVIVLGHFTCWSLSTCGHYTSTCPLSTSTYTHVPMSTCSHIHMSIVYMFPCPHPYTFVFFLCYNLLSLDGGSENLIWDDCCSYAYSFWALLSISFKYYQHIRLFATNLFTSSTTMRPCPSPPLLLLDINNSFVLRWDPPTLRT